MELKGYTNIPDWMLSFDLDVYETIILAVIYGFCQDGDSTFRGSQAYLAKKAKCSKRKVAKALAALIGKRLIEKIDSDVRGLRLCNYKVTPYCTSCKGDERGASGDERGASNNIEDNIDINTFSNKGGGRFQKPSLEDVRAYCVSRANSVDPERFVNFYESNGWRVGKNPMRDWRAAVRTWEKREAGEAETPRRRRETRRESVFEHNLRVMDEMFGTDHHARIYGGREDAPDEQ